MDEESGIYSIQRDIENQFDDDDDVPELSAGLDRTAPPRIESDSMCFRFA